MHTHPKEAHQFFYTSTMIFFSLHFGNFQISTAWSWGLKFIKKLQWEAVIPPAWVESVVLKGDHKKTSHPGCKKQHFNLETLSVMQGYFCGARGKNHLLHCSSSPRVKTLSKSYIYKQGNFSVPLLDLKMKIKALLGGKGQAYTQPTIWQWLHLEQRDSKINFLMRRMAKSQAEVAEDTSLKKLISPSQVNLFK